MAEGTPIFVLLGTRKHISAILILGLISVVPALSAQTWTQKGGTLSADPMGWAYEPAIAAASDGTIYAAWAQHTNPGNFQLVSPYAAKWTGSAWQALGGAIANPDQQGYEPAITVIGSIPYITWYEGSGYGWNTGTGMALAVSIFVAHWDGAQWTKDLNSQTSNGALNTSVVNPRNEARDPAIAAVNGMPYAAWVELPGSTGTVRHDVVVVKHLGSGQWIQDGPTFPAYSGVQAIILSVAVGDVGGIPYVAESQYTGTPQSNLGVSNTAGMAAVYAFSGGIWTQVGGPLNMSAANFTGYVSMTALSGVPYVAWQERTASGPNQIYVKHWNGTTWIQDGAGSLNANLVAEAGKPSISNDGAKIWLAWAEGIAGQKSQAYARSLSGGIWSAAQGSLNVDTSNGAAQSASVAGVGGAAQVIWSENDFNSHTRQVYVKGTDAGAPSATNRSPWGSNGPAVTLAANTWTALNAGGIAAGQSINDFGFDSFSYDPGIKKAMVLAGYHPFEEAENQNALLIYDFKSNRWDMLDTTNQSWSERLPNVGHDEGNVAVDPIHHSYITHGDLTPIGIGTGYKTYVYDLAGQRGKRMIPTREPDTTAEQASAFDSDDDIMMTLSASPWLYDHNANVWSRAPGPPSLNFPGLAYDTKHHVFVLFGGSEIGSAQTSSSQTWTYSMATQSWTRRLPPVSPPALRAPLMIYDGANGVVLLTGGRTVASDPTTASVQTWVYDAGLNTWTRLADLPAGVPHGPDGNWMTYDSDDQVTLLREPNSLRVWGFRYVPGPVDATPPARPQGFRLE